LKQRRLSVLLERKQNVPRKNDSRQRKPSASHEKQQNRLSAKG